MRKYLTMALLAPSLAVADWPLSTPPYAFIGIDAMEINTDRPVFCDRAFDAVQAGVGQEFTAFGIEFDSRLTHISCASVANDRNTYNAIGIQAKFYLWSK